jgi:anti-sigma-K factor RskA
VNEQVEEQASLYVFGLLEGADAANFERRLESDADLRALVDELDATAARLALTAPAHSLPSGLRSRILAEIRSNKTVDFPRRKVWIPWAIAACLALSLCYLVAERAGLRHRIQRLEERDVLAQIQVASLNSKLASAPNANAIVVWNERKQRGVLKVMSLPRNDEDHDYQLWLVDPRYKNPVDGGIFHMADGETMNVAFKPASPVREVKGFAISLERKGGVTKAEGPIVLLGK